MFQPRLCSNQGQPCFDDQFRHALGLNQEADLRCTRDRSRANCEEFVNCQVRANDTYSKAKRQISDRNKDVLMNIQSPHRWWSTFKSAMFGSSSSLPLFSVGGGLVCQSTTHQGCSAEGSFDSKQSFESVDLPLSSLTSVTQSYHLCLQV